MSFSSFSRQFAKMRSSHSNITLQTVADAAGVSVSTASRALNGRAKACRISEKTEQRVQATAEKLGFQPSQVARSLRSRRSGLIGVVVPDVSNSFFSSIAREVTLSAEAEGFSVVIADSRETTDNEKQHVQHLVSRQVEALVVCPVGLEFTHLEAIHQSALPLVLVDRCQLKSKMTQVTSNHRAGAEQAATLLIEQGHCRIGVLQGLPGTLPNEERLAGLRLALQRIGVTLDSRFIAGENFTEDSGYKSAGELLERDSDLTALFALSMPNAMGALRAAQELGREVPANLSIVTFDDSPFADFMNVPLSTAAQDIRQLGSHAGQLVMEQLQTGKKPGKKLHQIAVQIIRRSSISEVR